MKRNFDQTHRVGGQVGLILIMIMAAVSAVSLSLAGRAVTGLRTTETDVDSLRAFKAAEAGLERALSENSNVEGNVGGNLDYQASFESIGTSNGGYVTDVAIDPGVAIEVIVEGAVGLPGSLRFLWSDESRAALKISVYDYDSGANKYSVTSYAYDGDAARRAENKFASSVGALTAFEGINFSDYIDVPVTVNTLLVRILPLYQTSRVGVSPQGGLILPLQQFRVTATGNDSVANVTRKISFTKSGEILPSLFDHVLFTTGSLSQ